MGKKAPDLKTVHGRLRWVRNAVNWTQAELGEGIGETGNVIQKVEAGITEMSLDQGKRICRALRIELEWLAYGTATTYATQEFGIELTEMVVRLVRNWGTRLPILLRENDEQWQMSKPRKFGDPPPPEGKESDEAAAIDMLNRRAMALVDDASKAQLAAREAERGRSRRK